MVCTPHLQPFGTALPSIDNKKILRVCMQNTQNSFKIIGETLPMQHIIMDLKLFDVQMFAAISPNVNWCNNSYWHYTKNLYQKYSNQVHLLEVSSEIGFNKEYLHSPHLIGGAAILTLGLWVSKVISVTHDNRGHGVFTATTLLGKNHQKLTFISAYISVKKGTDMGTESMYAQQMTLYERACLKSKAKIEPFCPRKNAIKILDSYIQLLQQEGHGIILMLDANQAFSDCYNSSDVKPFTIEWLKITRGLLDPFIQNIGSHPPSTTHSPNHDIDYVLTFGIPISTITTLPLNTPAQSDHLGIIFDVDLASYFSASYSDTTLMSPRLLTSGNKKAVELYVSYVLSQFEIHKIKERAFTLLDKAMSDPLILVSFVRSTILCVFSWKS